MKALLAKTWTDSQKKGFSVVVGRKFDVALL